jgi:hypothetical protein
MPYLATAALLLTAASILTVTGVLFAPLVFGLFLLALVGVLARHTDQRVRPQEPPRDPRAWRGPA